MATIVTRAGKGAALTNNEVDANFTNLNTDKAELSGANFTGNINLSDNNKVLFGASDDLQISHVAASNRNLIRTNTDSELMFHHDSSNVGSTDEVVVGQFVANTEADNQGFRSILSIQHSINNANKAGRIVVESNASFSNNVNMYLQTGYSTSAAPRDRIKIANNGDISFFEDTGTTPKLFWDASTERLALGHTIPTVPFHLKATTNVPVNIETTHSNGNARLAFINENYQKSIGINSDGKFSVYDVDNAKTPFLIHPDVATNTLVLSGSNVGIGGTPSAHNLLVGSDNVETKIGVASNRSQFGYKSDLAVVQGGSGKGLQFNVNNNTFGSGEAMRINTSGNVGIGTTNPSAKLEVLATVPTYTNIGTVLWGGTTNNDNHTGISLSSAGDALTGSIGSNLYYSNSNTATQSNTNRSSGEIIINNTTIGGLTSIIRFGGYVKGSTTFTDRMIIDSAGRVGIGTTSPTQQLHVYHATDNQVATFESGDSTSALKIKDSTDEILVQNIGGIQQFVSNNTNTGTAGTRFLHGGSEKMRIDSSGNVRVDTTDANANGGGFSFRTGNVNYMNIAHDSSVGHGNYFVAFKHDNSVIGTITKTQTTGVSYNTSSDERLKENIADSADAGSKVDAIQIRQFDWIADGTHQDYGVIAQELVTVAPEAVHQPEDSEEMMGVDYSKLVPMLIKEVQSLRTRVAELENE